MLLINRPPINMPVLRRRKMGFRNKRMEKWRFKNLSKEQKLRLTMMVIAYGLLFYAVGVATNFLGSPIFSMFFVINYNTVHGVVVYVALAAAVALSVITLTLTLIKKQNAELPQVHNKPVIRIIKAPHQAIVKISNATNTLKMTSNIENNRVNQKNQQPTPPVIKPTKQSTVQAASQLYTVKNTTSNREEAIKEEKDRFTCPTCKKEFSKPLFMLEYVASTPKLIRHCPYCDQPIDKQHEDTAEEDLHKNTQTPT
jgi:uncharacterized Zn-finger protein